MGGTCAINANNKRRKIMPKDDAHFHQITVRHVPTGNSITYKSTDANIGSCIADGIEVGKRLFKTDDEHHLKVSVREI